MPDNPEALFNAIKQGDATTVERLLEGDPEGAAATDTNGISAANGWPPLVYCAAYNLPEPGALLLDRGADPNAPAPDGRTALTIAE